MKRRTVIAGLVALPTCALAVEDHSVPKCEDCTFVQPARGSAVFRWDWADCMHPKAQIEVWADYHLGKTHRKFAQMDCSKFRRPDKDGKDRCGPEAKYFQPLVAP